VAYRLDAAAALAGGEARSHLRATPLIETSEDGAVLKVAEPNEEDGHVCGPVLFVNTMKMHVSQGFFDTREFSRLLGRGCIRESLSIENTNSLAGALVLDLFYGLGITAGEALRLGARRVVAFERPQYSAVRRLAEMLPCPTVLPTRPDDPRILYRLCDLNNTHSECDFFDMLDAEALLFDAVVLDPPKRPTIMRRVYHADFLGRLALHLKRGAVVSCYAPTITSRHGAKVTWASKFSQAFLRTKKYRILTAVPLHPHIVRFQRL